MRNLLILFLTTLIFGTTSEDIISALKSKKYELALSLISTIDNKDDKIFYLASQTYYAIGNLDEANSNILLAIESKKWQWGL